MRLTPLLALALAATACPAEPARKKADPPGLIGVWACESRTEAGIMFPPPVAADLVVEFTADGKVRVRDGGNPEVEGAYTADSKKSPAEVDFTQGAGGDTFRAIYKVDGGVLTLCFEDAPKGARPAAFQSARGTKVVLLTLRRAESEKK
jgi:uncharacterized protein (TIGR03067 family)